MIFADYRYNSHPVFFQLDLMLFLSSNVCFDYLIDVAPLCACKVLIPFKKVFGQLKNRVNFEMLYIEFVITISDCYII